MQDVTQGEEAGATGPAWAATGAIGAIGAGVEASGEQIWAFSQHLHKLHNEKYEKTAANTLRYFEYSCHQYSYVFMSLWVFMYYSCIIPMSQVVTRFRSVFFESPWAMADRLPATGSELQPKNAPGRDVWRDTGSAARIQPVVGSFGSFGGWSMKKHWLKHWLKLIEVNWS